MIVRKLIHTQFGKKYVDYEVHFIEWLWLRVLFPLVILGILANFIYNLIA